MEGSSCIGHKPEAQALKLRWTFVRVSCRARKRLLPLGRALARVMGSQHHPSAPRKESPVILGTTLPKVKPFLRPARLSPPTTGLLLRLSVALSARSGRL